MEVAGSNFEFHPVDDGAAEGEFVGVLEIVSHGNTFGKGADDQFFPAGEFFVDIVTGRISFYGGS